jgi:predicted RNA-binding Zn-ribbon protein involved in translation (DUF1610 family)
MDTHVLSNDVAEGLSQNQIAEKHGVSQTTVRYWLSKCSLSTSVGSGPYRGKVKFTNCAVCNKDLKNSRRRLCGPCRIKVRRIRAKRKAVQLLGGKCDKCGWTGPDAGFHFHHVRGKKSFGIGDASHKSWALILKELKKCVLWCALCHVIHHSDREDPRLLKEVDNYQGQDLVM